MLLWLFGRVFGNAWKVVWWCVNASVVVCKSVWYCLEGGLVVC